MGAWRSDVVALRGLLFCFFGGLGCLLPFLPLHATRAGLSTSEAFVVAVVAPLVAGVGPLVAGPLVDRSGARALRVALAAALLLSALSHPLLLLGVPTRASPQSPPRFTCDAHGARVSLGCCGEEPCSDWPRDQLGAFLLDDCEYDCPYELPLIGVDQSSPKPHDGDPDERVIPEATLSPFDEGLNGEHGDAGIDPSNDDVGEEEEEDETIFDDTDYQTRRKKRQIISSNDTVLETCSRNELNNNECLQYRIDGNPISLSNLFLNASRSTEKCNKFCYYSVRSNVSCHIPMHTGFSSCSVRCALVLPEVIQEDLLPQSKCSEGVSFWIYLLVRSIADIFPTTAVGLLDAAIIIATCETNVGHGDVGRELAFGSLGFAFFAPIIGLMNTFIPHSTPLIFSFIAYAILMLLSMLILVCTKSLSLNRPEWWARHVRVMPLGGIQRHCSELICFVFILIVLGFLWSGIDSYLPMHLSALGAPHYLLGLTVTIGSLPAIPILWNSEQIVKICGHTNLLIIAFIFYIIRYTAYSYITSMWWSLVSEALEVFTMSILWVTVLLYMRQLVPRHLTVTSQGMAVFFHFCLGRCLGAAFAALICTYSTSGSSFLFIPVYQAGAVVSAVVASLYFIIYHGCLKVMGHSVKGPSEDGHHNVQQGLTSNGNYTPLRVYHNGSEQKNQVN